LEFAIMDRRSLLIGGGAIALTTAGAAYASVRRMGSMDEYNASVATARAPLPNTPEVKDFIRYAALAANSHNTQPWRFKITQGAIAIRPDMTRRIPVVDPDDHHLWASLGCAAENLLLAAQARGRPGELQFEPTHDGGVVFDFGTGSPTNSAMSDAIPHRQSTRSDYEGKNVSAAYLATLVTAATIPGVDLVLITDRPRINQVRDLIVAGNTAQMSDPSFVRELRTWLRFNPRSATETGDGLFSAASGNPILPDWLGPSLFDWVFKADAENAKYAQQIATSAGLAVFVSQKDDREHWVLAGRACQRFALQATALGLKVAFVNQPVEVARFRPELAALAGMPGRRPDIVMRFGYGAALPYSARRPVEAVLA
jgi:nitroreductase